MFNFKKISTIMLVITVLLSSITAVYQNTSSSTIAEASKKSNRNSSLESISINGKNFNRRRKNVSYSASSSSNSLDQSLSSSSSNLPTLNPDSNISSSSNANSQSDIINNSQPSSSLSSDSSSITEQTNNSSTIDNVNSCSKTPMIDLTSGYNYKTIKQLAVYQEVCQSQLASYIMVFIETPIDNLSAISLAQTTSKISKDFTALNLKPLFIVEPTFNYSPISFKDIGDGKYNVNYDVYFAELNRLGVTDQELGITVPFPEPNLPAGYWDSLSATPKDISNMYLNYFNSMARYFPSAQSGVLMNAKSYKPSDSGYTSGTFSDLSPYFETLPKGLVDHVFIQGFTWVSEDGSQKAIKSSTYLNEVVAMNAADRLGTKNIWIHTGSHSGVNNSNPKLILSIAERKEFSNEIINLYNSMSSKGYNVNFSIFLEDKSALREGINWSYLNSTQEKELFVELISSLKDKGSLIAFFDA